MTFPLFHVPLTGPVSRSGFPLLPVDPSYLGGTSPILVVDADNFDIMVPNPLLLMAIENGSVLTGTALVADGTNTYRWALGAFSPANGYPAVVAYHQQRRVFASTNNQPQTVWMSRVGAFPDFGVSMPVLDDDAVTFTLNSGQLNAIRSILSLRKMLLLTTDNEWIVGSGNEAAITPSAIQADVQGYRGSSKLVPVGVGNVAVYVQAKGQIVRDIGYEFASDSYTGNDLTVMAAHLTQGHHIVDWAYQQSPIPVIWMVREDGVLLGATYMREQQVIGWHRHDTDGSYEGVCVIPEGEEDVVYVTVAREINGSTRRFVERFETRFYADIREAFFVDCGSVFDGRTGNRGTTSDTSAITMTVSGGTLWDHTENLTVTASAPFFDYPGTTDVGDQIVFEDAAGVIYRLTIISTESTTSATATPNRVLAAGYRSTARTDWYVARDSISGLDYLEGKTVSILGDGVVQAQKVVSSGVISLDSPVFIANVGLPYSSDIETLEVMDNVAGVSLGKRKQITGAKVILEEASSLWAGRDYDHLEERKSSTPATYDAPIVLDNGVVDLSFTTPWSKSGSMVIRNTQPLPVSILGLIPEVTVGN